MPPARLALKLHPDSRCEALTRLEVEVARPRSDRLHLTYAAIGRIGDLRLPGAAASVRTDELWRHTCFEAFVRPAPGQAYYEFNFSPSREWAAYRFSGYRIGMEVATEIAAPQIEVQTGAEQLRLRTALDLPRAASAVAWRLGLSAVIKEASGRKSHWALAHPPGKPDFHHADCFALELPQAYRP